MQHAHTCLLSNQPNTMPPETTPSYALPIAILLAFGIIAGVIFFSNASQSVSAPQLQSQRATTGTTPSTEVIEPVTPVTGSDFVRGNPEAPIQIITYLDYDCATCKNYYMSLTRLIQDFGMNGQIAWTMRHMPLTEVHPNAMLLANAAECVGSLAGNRAFWKFTDALYDERSFFESTDISRIPEYAVAAGVDEQSFTTCVQEERYHDYLLGTANEAFAAGAIGAPYTIFSTNSEQGGLNGAQPYGALRIIVDDLFAQYEEFIEHQMEAQ